MNLEEHFVENLKQNETFCFIFKFFKIISSDKRLLNFAFHFDEISELVTCIVSFNCTVDTSNNLRSREGVKQCTRVKILRFGVTK